MLHTLPDVKHLSQVTGQCSHITWS